MPEYASPGDNHEVFTEWARSQGVQLQGIAAASFPGRGVGVTSTTRIKVGDVLAFVPASTIITTASVPRDVARAIGEITVHGLLAATLTLDAASANSRWPQWRAAWPPRQEFEHGLPLLWDSELQKLLPAGAEGILTEQRRKLGQDFDAVSKALPDISRDDYVYHWLIVNTRCFYYVRPGTKKKDILPPNDCMALCPFLDYLNHAPSGCEVSFSADGFTITSDRSYAPGQEIYISYGNHGNDMLMAEYGFILPDNAHDAVQLDHLILPRLSSQQKEQLKGAGYLGKYILDHNSVCHRTQVAMRLLAGMSIDRWQAFVNGQTDGEEDQGAVNDVLRSILIGAHERANTTLAALSNMSAEMTRGERSTPGYPVDMLRRRWLQILFMVDRVLDGLQVAR